MALLFSVVLTIFQGQRTAERIVLVPKSTSSPNLKSISELVAWADRLSRILSKFSHHNRANTNSLVYLTIKHSENITSDGMQNSYMDFYDKVMFMVPQFE